MVVSGVEPGSAADQAGISPGMVLRSVAGGRVYDATTATKLAASAAVPVQLGFDTTNAGALRNQATAAEPEPELQSITLSLQLARRPLRRLESSVQGALGCEHS